MKFDNKNVNYLFLSAFSLFITACSHTPTVQDFPNSANPSEEAKRLESDMKTALLSQIDVLSPQNFKAAQESLNDAQKNLSSQKDSQNTLHEIAEGRAYLNRANDVAKLSHINIEDIVVARQQAIVSGARDLFQEDFKNADDTLCEVTSDIEKNDLSSAAQNRGAIQASYLRLELKGIQHNNLGSSLATINQAKKEGAAEYAPRSLALAEKSVKDTDAFITANRHETAQLLLRSTDTRKSVDHLLKITRDAKAGNKTSSEEGALQMESEKNKLQAKQVELTQEQDAAQALTIENRTLTSEQTFNRSFEAAQKEFNHAEAEVYKQGNTLMIRLRGLEFPVAQALLRGSNFPLLAKVEKVIKGFGESSVIVEGHTDSNGGKILNEKLSTDRAEAVKQYLLANVGTNKVNITAKGFGYQKPLASNKTPDGRAQNRRVDIIIHPENIDLL